MIILGTGFFLPVSVLGQSSCETRLAQQELTCNTLVRCSENPSDNECVLLNIDGTTITQSRISSCWDQRDTIAEECDRLAAAAGGNNDFIVPDSGIWKGVTCNQSGADPCNFCDAANVGINIINYMFELVFSLAILSIIAGAIIFMTGGASEEKLSMGKKMMTNAVTGLAIALASWIIVNTLIHVLAAEDFTFKVWNNVSCNN